MKEQVTKFNLEAAFRALDEIEMPKAEKGRMAPNRKNLAEAFRAKPATDALLEDYYDVNDSDDLNQAQAEREAEVAKAKLSRIEKIVDLDAETEDDILPNYEGKMIIQCPQCMTLFYKDEADLEYSDDDPTVVNIAEKCQHCGNESGYNVIGKVAAVKDEERAEYEAAEENVEEASEEAVEGEELDLNATEEPVGEGEEVEKAEEGEEEDFDFDLGDLDLDEEPDDEEKKEESFNPRKNQDHLAEGKISDFISKLTGKQKDALKKELEKDYNNRMAAIADEQTNLLDDATTKEAEKQTTPANTAKAVFKDSDGNEVKVGDTIVFEKVIGHNEVKKGSTGTIKQIGMTNYQGKEVAAALGDWGKFAISTARGDKFSKNLKQDVADLEVADLTLESVKPLHEDAFDELMNSDEFKEPISEEEVQGYLDDANDENLMDKTFEALEEVEEEPINDYITESLKRVYSNINNFELTEFNYNNNKVILEGKINFNSGKSKNTKFVFNELKQSNVKPYLYSLNGTNKGIAEDGKFALNFSLKESINKLHATKFSYNYKIGKNLVEGFSRKHK